MTDNNFLKWLITFDCCDCSLSPFAGNEGYRPVYIPSDTARTFERIASTNTRKNTETCGILAGKLVGFTTVWDVINPPYLTSISVFPSTLKFQLLRLNGSKRVPRPSPLSSFWLLSVCKDRVSRLGDLGTCDWAPPLVTTLCLPDLIARDKISWALPLSIGIVEATNYVVVESLGMRLYSVSFPDQTSLSAVLFPGLHHLQCLPVQRRKHGRFRHTHVGTTPCVYPLSAWCHCIRSSKPFLSVFTD